MKYKGYRVVPRKEYEAYCGRPVPGLKAYVGAALNMEEVVFFTGDTEAEVTRQIDDDGMWGDIG